LSVSFAALAFFNSQGVFFLVPDRTNGRSHTTHRNEGKHMFSRHLRRHVNRWIDSVFVTAAALIISITPAVVLWDFGGVLPWTRYWICASIGIAALIALPVVLKNARLHSPFSLAVPLLCVVVWLAGTAQTWQLPGGLVRWLAPGSAAAYTHWVPAKIWAEAGASVDTVRSGSDGQSFPISVCAWLTRQWLVFPAIFGITAFLSGFVFRTRRAVLLLLWVTALSGTALAFFGMLSIVRTGEGKASSSVDVYIHEVFLNPTPFGTTVDSKNAEGFRGRAFCASGFSFGPFVAKNSAAGYLTLSIACTLGLLIYWSTNRKNQTAFERGFTGEPDDVWRRCTIRFDSLILAADATLVVILIVTIVQFAGLVSCGSRGGVLAAMSGILWCMLNIRLSNSARLLSFIVALASFAAAGVLSRVQLLHVVSARIASTFSVTEGAQVGRLQHWQDSLVAAANYFPLGSGCGTYRYAYLPSHRFNLNYWFVNADSMPMEWLVEGGIWLLPCILMGSIAFGLAIKEVSQRVREAHCQALASVGWFIIAAMLVSQSFDYGILIPPVHLTLAALIGAISGVLSTPQLTKSDFEEDFDPMILAATIAIPRAEDFPGHTESSISKPVVNGVVTIGLLIIFLLVWCISLNSTRQAAISDFAIREIRRSHAKLTDDYIAGLFSQTVACDPMMQLVVAEALLKQQMSSAIARVATESDNNEVLQVRRQASITDRRALFYSLCGRSVTNLETCPRPAEVLLPGQDWAAVLRARQLAAVSKTLCPLEFRSNTLLVNMDFVAGDSSEIVNQLIQQCIELWPENTDIVESLARMAFAFPGRECAIPLVSRLLTIHPNSFRDVWPLIAELGETGSMLAAFTDNPETLVNAIVSAELPADLEEVLSLKAMAALDNKDILLKPTRVLYLRSLLWARRGNIHAAIESIARALQIDPTLTDYRQRYVDLLDSAGESDQAIEQLRRCIAQKPADRGLIKKLDNLLKKAR